MKIEEIKPQMRVAYVPMKPSSLMKPTPVSYVVTKQGGPILNAGHVIASGGNIAAVHIDMKSKRCDIMAESEAGDGTPVIWVDGTNALHLTKGQEREHTEVAFPDYKGWEIFSAHISRYTFRVCFVRASL